MKLIYARIILAYLVLMAPAIASAAQNQPVKGEYYLFNQSSGLYLNAGGYWGTQAVFGPHAQVVTVEPATATTCHIMTGYTGGGEGALAMTSDGIFLDSQKQEWTITATSPSTYTISSPSGSCLGYDGTTTVAALPDPTAEAAQWQLLTRQQMLDKMLNGQSADATFLITNPRFDRHCEAGGWGGTTFNTGGEQGSAGNGNYCAEVWNTNFDVSQTLSNIPNGTYRLTMQGFYRYNNTTQNTNSVAYQAHSWGYEQLYAKLYANDVETSVMSIAAERSSIRRMGLQASNSSLPFSMAEAANAFTAGLYANNQIDVEVTSHQLTFGVRKTQQDGCDWTVWDNFQLTLLTLGDNTGYDTGGTQGGYDDASPENPIDLTSRITNPQMNATTGWNGSPVKGGTQANPNAEKYNTTFDVWQQISGLPNGLYRVTAQGFYRYGDYHDEQHKSYYGGGWEENDANNIYAMYTIPYAVISRKLGIEKALARLYANNAEVGLPSPFDYAHEEQAHTNDYYTELGWVPDTQTGASEAFSAGEYPVELTATVTDGTLRLGVRKSLGYKYDWTCFDNFHLYYLGTGGMVYADGVEVDARNITMTVNQRKKLSAKVLPYDATDKTLQWKTTDSGVVEVDNTGLLVAKAAGNAVVSIWADGSDGKDVVAYVNVTVDDGSGDASALVINEIQVSNTDMFVDPSYNYGGYIELYNPTGKNISLRNLYVSDDAANPLKCRLTSKSGAVEANGYALVWFDHRDTWDGNVDFKLDMDGGLIMLSDASGTVLASQQYPAAVSRTSWARTTDGGSKWGITAYPTPGRSNSLCPEYVDATAVTRLGMPQVSHQPQMFSAPFTMTCDIPAGATLRYTTDGSVPTETHSKISADGTFAIDTTTVLRLRLFKSGMLPSSVRTCSYILSDKAYTLPVLSVAADPEDLYGDSLGIFVTGSNGIDGSGISFRCNWNMDWERAANFDFILPDNSGSYSQEAAITRFGGWSRAWYPYNFKLKAQKVYEGLNYMEYPFFGNKPYLKHKVLQVRNGGNDLMCRIKDVALQHIITTSGFHLDCQDYMPVHSFVNGKYQGMLNIREPSNKHFAYANYGIDTDLMDQMELGGSLTMMAGTADAFNRWASLAANAANADSYRQICDLVDVDEFANYMATQLFLGGDDWPGNNCKAFKGNDGKFHIVLFDVDQALRFDAYAFTHVTNNRNCPLMSIFFNMLQNDTFRKLFTDTYCIVGGSVFEPSRCVEIIDRISAEMNPALALEGLSTDPTASYVKAALSATRRNTMMAALATWSYAGITSREQRVKMSSNIPSAALQVNGIHVPTGRFDGSLFAPAIITASAPEGFTFKGWADSDGNIVAENREFDISGHGDLTLTATWEPVPAAALVEEIATPIKVNEVSASNSVYINEWYKKNDWIELYNNTDSPLDVAGLYLSDDIDEPMKYQIPDGGGVIPTVIPARGHLVVWADKLEPLSQLHANFKLGNTDGSMVIVTSSQDFVSRNASYFASHPEMSAFAEGLTYVVHRGDQTVGRYPDGGRYFYLMSKPTIQAANSILTADSLVGEDINLMDNSSLFAVGLKKGWNWVSHNLSDELSPGDMPSEAARIVGHLREAVRDPGKGMTGNLRTLVAGSLYKVLMDADGSFAAEGQKCRADMPIALKEGWNWIGYTAEGTQTLAEALSGYDAGEGDRMVGQDGFAIFSNGRWTGTLSSLSTGRGYMLYSGRARTLRFTPPTLRVNVGRPMRASAVERQYGFSRYAYPNVMGVVAQLQKDGIPVEEGRYTLLAYCGDECRGAGKWVDACLFTTIYGEGGEALHFLAADIYDGTVYEVAGGLNFNAGTEGTPDSPVVLQIGSEIMGEPDYAQSALRSGASVEGYYSLSGVRMASKRGALPEGIYIVRYSDGTSRKKLFLR